jgi:radical SAM superfamily enzyme YgiQ (UPF0313 family)
VEDKCRSAELNEFVKKSREMQPILIFWHGVGVALPTLAALTPVEHEVVIIDENKEPVEFDRPCDIVGITAITPQAVRAYEIADEFRKRGRYVVLGGIHATVMPYEARTHADTVVVGEAENIWSRFLMDYISANPHPIYDQKDFAPVDMTRIPLPRYDLLAKYRYPAVYVQATRGCPHDCEFCLTSNVYGKRYKQKTVAQMVREVQEVKKYWKYARIGFADDNLFVNHRYARELVTNLRELNVPWFAESDVTVAQDEEFLRDLYESGCKTVFIGFESISKNSLHTLNTDHWKENHCDHYAEYISRIQSHGIGILGSFILGFDDDRPSIVDDTIKFIIDNNILSVQFWLLTPGPGSRLRKRLEGEKRILHSDWQRYTGWNAVIRHPHFTSEELEKALLCAYKGVYSAGANERRARYFRKVFENLLNAV